MLPDEMMEESQIFYDEITCPKSNDTVKNYDLKKGNNEFVPTKEEEDVILTKNKKNSVNFSGQQVVWSNVILIAVFHAYALYCFIAFPYIERFKSFFFSWVTGISSSIGVTAGAHRLWTHRSYKAKTPLRILLLCLYYTAGMNSLFNWVRDHRVHHKFSETDADPHNSNRGFFFCHVGWLMLRKHPEVIKKGRQIDMSDITSDPVAAFGEKYFWQLKFFFCFTLPVIIPVYFWNEDWYYAIATQWFMRYALTLNFTWSVNSVAHMFGGKPFNKSIAPTENAVVSWLTGGEGWHNYHHTFPWDYKAAELNHKYVDLATHFINFFAAFGWAYDLNEPSEDLVKNTIARKGDGTHIEVPLPSKKTNAIIAPLTSSDRVGPVQKSFDEFVKRDENLMKTFMNGMSTGWSITKSK